MIVIALFFLLLLLGVPIVFMITMAATAGVAAYTTTPLLIVIQSMYSTLNSFVLLAIPLFVVAGSLASGGKTSKYLIDVMNIFFGWFSGGPVVAAIAACAFFAAISGSAVATVVAIGGVMIPGLINGGYSQRTAVGVIGAGGTLGVLIPPSTPMVVFAVALGCSVGKLFTAGLVPGILLAALWAVYSVIECRRKGCGKPIKYPRRDALGIVVRAVPAMLFPVIVLGSIYAGWATPTESAAISVLYVLLIELFVYRSLSLREVPRKVFRGLVLASTATFMMAASGVLTWFITYINLPNTLSQWIIANIGSKEMFLLAIVIFLLVAGMFVGLQSLVVVICPILLPSLLYYEIDLIHFGIICVMMAQIGFLTPPFGTNLFVTMSVSKRSFGEVVKSTLPYTLLLLAMALLIAYCPAVCLWLPEALGM
ncbi:TRAP transporter large permease [uncultured Oscillibacter sp.]|uniref:TRAP transporter large permease n=1 Tax=uncultured Oscillibacter sp. TaxID=876091 RepID=UPI0025FC7F4E|nr:TRAP transporter large permease [uncultured Oscillibacter sp.]